jgi:hypothetical protein
MQVRDKSVFLSGVFADDSSVLITMHESPFVSIWATYNGSMLAYFACDSPIHQVACTPQGAVALGTPSGIVHFLQLPLPQAPLAPSSVEDGAVSASYLDCTLLGARLSGEASWPLKLGMCSSLHRMESILC